MKPVAQSAYIFCNIQCARNRNAPLIRNNMIDMIRMFKIQSWQAEAL